MARKSLRERFGSFTTGVAAVAVGGGLGAILARRMLGEMRNLDQEQITKLANKYLPMFMAMGGREMNSDSLDTYACADCSSEFMPLFMLRDELWWTVLTDEERPKQFDVETKKPLCPGHDEAHGRVAVCLRCCSKRIERPLRPDDFAADYWTSGMLRDAAESVGPAPADPTVVAG